jgi:hypothetical protein
MKINYFSNEDINELKELQTLGYTTDPETGQNIQDILDSLQTPPVESFSAYIKRTGGRAIRGFNGETETEEVDF